MPNMKCWNSLCAVYRESAKKRLMKLMLKLKTG